MAERLKVSDILESALSKMKELGETETIIGKPVTAPEGITIIPVSKLSCGYGAGGSDYNSRHNSSNVLFGGAGGGGIEVTPVSFIVIRGDRVDVLPAAGTVSTPAPAGNLAGTIEKLAEILPGVVEKLEAFAEKQKQKKAAATQEAKEPEGSK
jgi:sporulation protein YtfJ